jgi:hypothetical protein
MTIRINRFYPKETFVPETVVYSIDVDGKPLVIEHTPARVRLETGGQLFSAEAVERIQQWTEKRTNHEISSWH